MMQAMVLAGVLVICAAAGVLLTFRHGRTQGPDEPTGSYAPPVPPVPSPPPAFTPPSAPPAPRPSQPLPVETSAAAPPVVPTPSPVRRSGRNSGFNRYAPAAQGVRRVTPGTAR
jgi:hypothetical protein